METERTEALIKEVAELRLQLEEARDTIEAIRTGQIDAIIVEHETGHRLYTLKNADHTYRAFIEKMTEGAVTLDKNGVILYSNSRFAALLNIPLENLIGVPLLNFLPDNLKSEYNKLLQKGWTEDAKAELDLLGSGGKHVPFLLSLTALELEDGTAMSIILTDLTSVIENRNVLKAKNDELEEAQRVAVHLNDELQKTIKERTRDLLISQGNFKFLSDNIPVIVWTADANGEFDYFNQQWIEYTGLSAEESLDSNWTAAIYPDDVERTLETWRNSLLTGKDFETEYRLKKGSSGDYLWHLAKAIAFSDEDGKVMTWLGTKTNIEDQKQAIAKKDEFIGIASHELKTPLTSLKGYLQLISTYKKEEVPTTIRQFTSRANEAIGKLANLVNDLLDVSKIQTGKLTFSKSPLSLNTLIVSCAENARFMYPTYNIRINHAEDVVLVGNQERLEQVIMNLINNSVKYSPVNKEVILSTKVVGDSVTVSVKDFGIGLSDHQKDRIFERFYRVDDKNFAASGLGIGLYISAEIIKAHHGKFGVDSKLHEGSTFFFILPING